MSKIYSTAEVVDQLKVGQEAVAVEPIKDVVIKKNSDGTIVVMLDHYSEKYVGKPLPFTGIVWRTKWELRQKPITFIEALNYIKMGNEVRCITSKEQDGVVYDSLDELIHLREAVEGKWYFEDSND